MAAELQPEHAGKLRGEELLGGIGEELYRGNNTRWIIFKGQNKLKVWLREKKKAASTDWKFLKNDRLSYHFCLLLYSAGFFLFDFLTEAAAELLLFVNGFYKSPVRSISNVLHLLRILHGLKVRNDTQRGLLMQNKRLCNGGSVGGIGWGFGLRADLLISSSRLSSCAAHLFPHHSLCLCTRHVSVRLSPSLSAKAFGSLASLALMTA